MRIRNTAKKGVHIDLMYLSASLFDLDDPSKVPDVGLELQKLVPHFHRILGGEASRRQNSLKQNPGITGDFLVAKQQYRKY